MQQSRTSFGFVRCSPLDVGASEPWGIPCQFEATSLLQPLASRKGPRTSHTHAASKHLCSLQRYVASLLDNAGHSINRNFITKMTGGWEPVHFVQCPHTISITDLSWRPMYLPAAVNNSYRYSVGKQGNALTMTSLTCPKSLKVHMVSTLSCQSS